MAYKVFTNGSPLPASDLNTYLMNQSVMVFADSTARSAALTSPTEGMVTYLEDTNKLEVYTGAAWVDVNDNAAAIPKSTVTAAGDLIVADGNASVTRLGIGASGQVLSSNGTTATWITPVTPDSVITTQGDLIIGNSSGDATRLGIGTNNQVLVSNGTTASWQTVSSGAATLLSTTTLSGSAVTISGISGSYDDLIIEIDGLTSSTSAYWYLFYSGSEFSGLVETTAIVDSSYEPRGSTAGTIQDSALRIRINNYADTTRQKTHQAYGMIRVSNSWFSSNFAGGSSSEAAITSITMEITAGTMGGTVKIYGTNR